MRTALISAHPPRQHVVVDEFSYSSSFLPRMAPNLIDTLLVMLFLGFAMIFGIPTLNGQVPESQTVTGVISGIVFSRGNNRSVANVIVSVRSDSEGISRSVLTDSAGQFEVQGIPTGQYVISIEEPGYDYFKATEQLDGASLKLLLYLVPSTSQQANQSAYTVSVRELNIPYKAQDEFRKGLEHLKKNAFQESLNHFLKATRIFKEYFEAYYHVGLVQLKLGRRDEAMQSFQESINLSGGHYARAQYGMGYVLYLQGRPREAEKALRRGLEADASLPEGHAILGMVLLQLDRVEEAERSEREALLRNPNFAQAYLVLSEICARRRDYRQQIQDLDSYLKLQPTGPESERAQRTREATLTLLAQASPQN
jgi:tetratricopeptide (TPR) repeat protein